MTTIPAARLLLLVAAASPAAAESWSLVYEVQDNRATFDLGAAQTNGLFARSGVVRYDIKGDTFAVFERLTGADNFDAHALITQCWSSRQAGEINQQFRLFGTIAEWRAGRNPWQFCNYDDCNAGAEVGAFRDCAPTGPPGSRSKFHNIPSGSHQGQPTTSFYVLVPSPWGWLLISALLVGGAIYVGGGVLLGRRAGSGGRQRGGEGRRGWRGASLLLRSHPHWAHWKAAHALVMDGVALTLGRRSLRPGKPGLSTPLDEPLASRAQVGNGREKRRSDRKKSRKHRGGSQSPPEGSESQAAGLGAAQSRDGRQPLPSGVVSGGGHEGGGGSGRTAPAGGGGRWVRVPT
jgi:hypothetical protein